MSDSLTSLEQLYQSFVNELNDSNTTKSQFINRLNLFLLRILPTKPCEMMTPIYYLRDYDKYALPSHGYRDPIAMYSDNVPIISYVSPFRYQIGDPTTCFTDQGNSGYRYMKLKNPFSTSIVNIFTLADSLTNDGSWSIAGGAALTIDPYTKIQGSGSIKFSINTSQCILTFNKTTPILATDFTDFMRLRFNAWIPNRPTSIKVRLGNNNSNYYEQALSTQVTGEPYNLFSVNEFEFAQELSTMTGIVDKSEIDFLEIEFNFSAAISTPNFRINKICIGKPEVMNFEWYTSYGAIDANGSIKQIITVSEDTTDDTIIKDYPLYVSTVLDGLIFDELKIKDPERAKIYQARYVGEKDDRGRYINGLGLIRQVFPNRRTNYKRMKTLPDLNYNPSSINNSVYYTDSGNN